MIRGLLFFFLLGHLFIPNLFAESFELKQKKIKINKKNAGVFPEIELRPRSPSNLKKEPKYRSRYSQKFFTPFGKEAGIEVTFSVDEKKGTGKGFDLLYVDVNGSGDLQKGKKLAGKTTPADYYYDDTSFPAFELQIPFMEGVKGYPLQARFFKYRNQRDDSSLYLTPLLCLEGGIQINNKNLKMVVFDANCNGVFGEKGAPSGKAATGDKIWIGTSSSKLEDACVEALPLGKYYLFQEEYYEIAFNEESQVQIQKAEVPLGKLRVNNPGFILELVEGNNVLYVSNDKGQEINVPVGKYRVNTAGFRRKYKGAVWTLEGQAGAVNEHFVVKEDTVQEISVGPPLKIKVKSDLFQRSSGLAAYLDFYIEGSAGERYRYLRKNGKKIDLPEVSIRSARGKEVEKGKFHYG